LAGDWIKMRADLAEDPAVIAMAARLGIDEFAVVGRLHAFWSWLDRQSRDGHALGVTHSWLDRHVHCDGFASSLVAVGWLVIDGAGLSIPHFDRHNGETAKARALTRNRKRRQRAGGVTQESRSQRDISGTREEKRREEEEEKENAPAKVVTPDFAAIPRLQPQINSAGFTYPPSDQIVIAWLSEYGEDLISETLVDCGPQLRGKNYRYLESILTNRRNNPNERPGNRRKRVDGRPPAGDPGASAEGRKVSAAAAFGERVLRIDPDTGDVSTVRQPAPTGTDGNLRGV
jgi:hypothetical protein